MEEIKKPDNPPVHPTTWDSSYNTVMQTENGMTLRDHFAGLAMQAMVSREHCSAGWSENEANQCYVIADMMLKAREL